MNQTETVILARYVKALCPQQKFDEFTPDAWHDVLSSYSLAEARTAAATVARRQPFVAPSEIITELTRGRNENAADFQGPGLPAAVPDADPDDVPAYLAAIRTQRTLAADGADLKPRPIAELIAGVVDSFGDIPERDAPDLTHIRRPGPLGVNCPTCRASIGRPCQLDTGNSRKPARELRQPHAARIRVSKGEPAVSETTQETERRRTTYLARLEQMAATEQGHS